MRTTKVFLYLVTVVLLIVWGCGLLGCRHDDPQIVADVAQEKVEEKFNTEKDRMIVGLLNRGDGVFSYKNLEYVNAEMFEVKFPELKIRVWHDRQVPYEKVEKWDYSGTYVDGRMLILTSSTGTVKHQISQNTLSMIQQYCINKKQKNK